jgi:hypothetical protein
MHGLFATLALLAAGIAAGFHHRVCAALFTLGFTYAELIDRTNYLNHYYLVSLLTALLVFLPADRVASWRPWRRDERNQTVPAWTVNLLRFQVAVVYVFAGIAKLNADWLFAAQPLRIWLNARADLPLIGPWLSEPWVALAASWAGALFDLTIPFLLLWRRTRPLALPLAVVFHVATAVLFPTIGMFPWLMLAAATTLLPAGWPRHLPGWNRMTRDDRDDAHQPDAAPRALAPLARGALVLYCAVQILVPLRAWFMPGDCRWTGEGFDFSWRVMVAEKAGLVEFQLTDPRTGRVEVVSPGSFLTPLQAQMMAQSPGMIRDAARHLARTRGGGVEVRATAYATLNGRPPRLLLDLGVNLAAPELPAGWICPLPERGGTPLLGRAAPPPQTR